MTDQQRAVSYPPGETTYREFFYRTKFADGTIFDSPPVRIGAKAPAVGEIVARTLTAMRADRSGNTVRMEREVRVTASEWIEVPKDQPLVDVEKVGQVLPQGDPNDYCQRALCGHARGFHPTAADPATTMDVQNGPCTRCVSPGKCAGFVAKREKASEA